MKKVFLLLGASVVVALLIASLSGNVLTTSRAPMVFASRLAGMGGPGNSGIQIQNLHPTDGATIVAELYPQGGGAPISLSRTAVGGGSANIYLPSESGVPEGAYAAIISANTPIAAIARTEWADEKGAATYSNVDPATAILIPLAVEDFANQFSQFSIQNTDTSESTTITVKVFARGQSDPVVEFTDSVLAGTSKTYDLSDSGQFPDLPTDTWPGIPGFVGSITVDADNPIVVQSFVDFGGGSKAVYAFSGIDKDAAATKLLAPLARRAFAGATTGISLVNPNPTEVTVDIDYIHNPASQDQNDYEETLTIEANSSEVAYQGAGPMPAGWLGSAVIEATGPIVAMVNDATSTTSAAYNAPSEADGAMTVSVPLVRNKQVSAYEFTTGVQVMNIGSDPADIAITYRDSAGNPYGPETATAVAGNQSYTFYQPSGPFPVGAYGSATVTSNQPIVVIVNDISLKGLLDAAIYNGIQVPE